MGSGVSCCRIPEIRRLEATHRHLCIRFPGESDPMIAGVIGAMEKELPKHAKLKRLRAKIFATDEWKYWNSAI